MVKWEYKTIFIGDTNLSDRYGKHAPAIEDRLNALGAEGWELISILISNNHAYFKRPLAS